MATEIVEMVVDTVSLDTANPIVTFGGVGKMRNMTVKIPLDYKDSRVDQPFRSGGYDQRVATDGLIGPGRICTIHFDEIYDPTCPNYRAVYDKYSNAFGDGSLVGLLFRSTDGLRRVRNARLLSMPWQSDAGTPINATMDMTFAVDFYARDLYPTGAAIYGAPTAKYGTSKYGTTGIYLPLRATTLNGSTAPGATSFTLTNASGMTIGSTLTLDSGPTNENIVIQNVVGNVVTGASGAIFAHSSGVVAYTTQTTFVTPSTAVTNTGVLVLTAPIPGPIGVSFFYGPNNSKNMGFVINESLSVAASGYIDYYQIDAGTETVIRNGIEIFDLTKFKPNGNQNDFFDVPKGRVTIVVAPASLSFGPSSALYLSYVPLYI